MIRTRLAALAAVLLLAGCGGDPPPTFHAPSAAAPATSAPAASTTSALPRAAGYVEPCQRVAKLAGEWVDLVVRVAESENFAEEVTRPELESLINRLAEVTPLLPAEVQPLMPSLVDPLVVLRGILMTGVSREVEFGPGRDAVLSLFEGCGAHVPNYDDGPGGAADPT